MDYFDVIVSDFRFWLIVSVSATYTMWPLRDHKISSAAFTSATFHIWQYSSVRKGSKCLKSRNSLGNSNITPIHVNIMIDTYLTKRSKSKHASRVGWWCWVLSNSSASISNSYFLCKVFWYFMVFWIFVLLKGEVVLLQLVWETFLMSASSCENHLSTFFCTVFQNLTCSLIHQTSLSRGWLVSKPFISNTRYFCW